jgi:hypothetical protein
MTQPVEIARSTAVKRLDTVFSVVGLVGFLLVIVGSAIQFYAAWRS